MGNWIAAAALSLPVPGHAGDVYGYVDDDGVTHLSAAPLDGRYVVFFRAQDLLDSVRERTLGVTLATGIPPRPRPAAPQDGPWREAVQEAARTHALDPELLHALIATESAFDAGAVSPKGARGLMQLMPATAQRYGVRADGRLSLEAKLHDPRVNIAAGSHYLADLIRMFGGSLELALAAYNAGEGAVRRAGNRIPGYPETQNYVKTVMRLYAQRKPLQQPERKNGAALLPW